MQDFLNGVCTNIIHMHQKQLKYYTGGWYRWVVLRIANISFCMQQRGRRRSGSFAVHCA